MPVAGFVCQERHHFHPKKFQFAQNTVDFAGLEITKANIRPSAKFLDFIRNFPVPTDITVARAWFGLSNQCAYAFAMTKQMKPFQNLLKPSTVFFGLMKRMLCSTNPR